MARIFYVFEYDLVILLYELFLCLSTVNRTLIFSENSENDSGLIKDFLEIISVNSINRSTIDGVDKKLTMQTKNIHFLNK